MAAIIILGALGFLVARGLANAMNYYMTANQAVAQRAQLGSTDFRIQGKVLPGVHEVGTTLHFVITVQATSTSTWSVPGRRHSCSAWGCPWSSTGTGKGTYFPASR